MRYLHSMVRVSDLDASLKFYCETLGMKEVRRSESEAGKFTLVYLAAPGDLPLQEKSMAPVVELTYNWPGESSPEDYGNARNFGHLAFAVDNIYEVCAKVEKAGVTINRPPRDGWMAFFKSPDNISIELLQTGKPLAPKEPWASKPNQGSW